MVDRKKEEQKKRKEFETEALPHMDALYRTALRMTRNEKGEIKGWKKNIYSYPLLDHRIVVLIVMDPKNWTLPLGVELRTRKEVQNAEETQNFQCGVQSQGSA